MRFFVAWAVCAWLQRRNDSALLHSRRTHTPTACQCARVCTSGHPVRNDAHAGHPRRPRLCRPLALGPHVLDALLLHIFNDAASGSAAATDRRASLKVEDAPELFDHTLSIRWHRLTANQGYAHGRGMCVTADVLRGAAYDSTRTQYVYIYI